MRLTPTQLKVLCKEYGLTPSKRYGQNFLISDSPIKKMIVAADLKKTDTVVEIGPGFGVLTFALAERAKKVIAYEIERKLKPFWDKHLKEYPNVEVIWRNALKGLRSSVFGLQSSDRNQKSEDRSQYKVIANLPYQITSHVLRTILDFQHKPTSITVMVQKEVAQRICAGPGDMSLLAVSVQYYGIPKIITKVPAGNFWPQPKVDSAVLHIGTTAQQYDGISEEKFFRLAKAGFANKRKQLWRNISDGLSLPAEQVKKAVKEVTGNEKSRAQELSVDYWKKLISILTT
jgi:16S rRNA (adenine1518-N6/adenine1519-N6)-dimethyltransferase